MKRFFEQNKKKRSDSQRLLLHDDDNDEFNSSLDDIASSDRLASPYPSGVLDLRKKKAKRKIKCTKNCAFISLLAYITCVGVALAIAWFVVLPQIAQDTARKATVTFNRVFISDETEGTFRVQANVTLKVPTTMFGTLSMDATTLTLGYDGEMGTMPLEPVSFGADGVAVVSVDEQFTITDGEKFEEFALDLISGDEVSLQVGGEVTVTAHSLSLGTVALDVHATVPGMQGLRSLEIEEYELPSARDNGDGVVLEAACVFDNKSPFGIELGEVRFALLYHRLLMGEVRMSNFTLQPLKEQQRVPMHGVLSPMNMKEASEFFSEYIAGNASAIVAKGITVESTSNGDMGDGGQGSAAPSWLATLVSNLSIDATLPGMPEAQRDKLVGGLDFEDVAVVVDETAADNVTVLLSVNGTATLYKPFGFDVTVHEINPTLDELRSGRGGVVVGHSEPYGYEKVTQRGVKPDGGIVVSLTVTKLPIVYDEAKLTTFLIDTLLNETVSVGITLRASAKIDTPMGLVELASVSFNTTLALRAFSGLNDVQLLMNQMNVTGSTDDGLLECDTAMSLKNPANFSLHFEAREPVPLLVRGRHAKTNTFEYGTMLVKTMSLPASVPSVLSGKMLIPPTLPASTFVRAVMGGPAMKFSLEGAANGTDDDSTMIRAVFDRLNMSNCVFQMTPEPFFISGKAKAPFPYTRAYVTFTVENVQGLAVNVSVEENSQVAVMSSKVDTVGNIPSMWLYVDAHYKGVMLKNVTVVPTATIDGIGFITSGGGVYLRGSMQARFDNWDQRILYQIDQFVPIT